MRIAGRDRVRVTRAETFVGRRRIVSAAAKAVSQRIRRPRVRGGRAYLLRVRAELRDGRRLTLDRRLRGCS